jgi:hypothetical protein
MEMRKKRMPAAGFALQLPRWLRRPMDRLTLRAIARSAAGNCNRWPLPWYRAANCVLPVESTIFNADPVIGKFTQAACTLQQIATDIEKQLARHTKHSCARQNKTTCLIFSKFAYQ